ncbi:kinesin-like protein KIF20B [Diachasma alloeum]|uniref:kinesin-like protein KIF20B n=1 Tax=Diachasma alloeum TaxID=454923 RepID=UPI00073818FC|nr:kinesin-like protein KIF20B [Diachasma alloeum]
MSYSTENLFESTRLSEDSSRSSRRPQSVNLNETRTIKRELTDDFADSLNGSRTSQTVKVFLRLKPRTPKTKRAKKIQEEMYVVSDSKTLLTKFPSPDGCSTRRLKSSEATSKKFSFTKILTLNSSQDEVFKDCTGDTILDFLSGQNSTVMTYGTTDSGKTFSLYGSLESPGIIPRSIEFIFSAVNCTLSPWYKPLPSFEIVSLDEKKCLAESMAQEKLLSKLQNKVNTIDTWKLLEDSADEEYREPSGEALYSAWLSFAEIYNENIYDLLGEVDEGKTSPLKLATDKQGRSFIPGLTMICVTTGLEAYQVLLTGQSRLSVSSEPSDSGSSLSHSIFSITLLKYFKECAVDDVEVSTLTFCDLAGSGRNKLNVTASGESLKEARNIKAGLLALGKCLQSVHDRQSSKLNSEAVGAFRESKLTRLFQRCLSGKEQLTIIAHLNPSPDFYVENQSILHLCSIARRITVPPGKELKKISGSQLTIPSPIKDIAPATEESPVKIEDKYENEYRELEDQNSILKKEIEILRSNATVRELKIREEMANFCSTMMKDMESNWRMHARAIEEDQEDLLKWSVKQVETFYKERIDSLTNRKRRRRDSDDDVNDSQSSLDILEAENARITTKYMSVKETLRATKKECDALRTEKNTCAFELGLANEELREIREVLSSEHECSSFEYKDLLKYLKLVIFKKNETIKSLEESLDELTRNQSREQIEAEDPENESQNTTDEVSSIFVVNSMQSNSSDSSSDTIGPQSSLSSIITVENLPEFQTMNPSTKITPNIFETIDKTLDLIKMDRQGDSGIGVSSRISSSTRNSMMTETEDKSTQTSSPRESEHPKKEIEQKVNQLKLDYKALQLEHLEGSIRINELSKELEHIRRVMQNLKEMMSQSDQKIVEYQLKLASQEVDLENLKECNIELESKLSKAYLDQEKSSLQCITTHIHKINKLSSELEEKTCTINSLNQRISTIERDLQMVHNLEDRVSDFSVILEKCKREKEELREELQKRLRSQSSLECRLKLLSSRVQDRENEITSLRTDLAGMVRMNTVNGERVNELGEGIANALDKLTTVKEEMRRSEVERRELERTSSHEISNLAARFKRSTAMLNMIHEGNDDVRGELAKMKELLLKKEREMALFKKNRESTIRRYELLVRKLQGDVERNNRELLRARGHSKRAISKESLESVEQESSREVHEDSLIKGKSSRRTLNVKNRSRHHCRLTCSAKRLSSHIVASLTSLEAAKSNNCEVVNIEKLAPKKKVSSTHFKVLEADRRELTIPREVTTPSITSSSDDSSTDYKELSNWMKVKRTNGRTQFVIRQAEITVENVVKRSISES